MLRFRDDTEGFRGTPLLAREPDVPSSRERSTFPLPTEKRPKRAEKREASSPKTANRGPRTSSFRPSHQHEGTWTQRRREEERANRLGRRRLCVACYAVSESVKPLGRIHSVLACDDCGGACGCGFIVEILKPKTAERRKPAVSIKL